MQQATVSTKTLLTLMAPAALVTAGTATMLLAAPDAAFLEQAANGYPLVALAATLVLAWRLQRSRLFIAAIVLAAATTLLDTVAVGSDPTGQAAVAVSLALGLALLACTVDRAIGAPRARLQLLIALGPGIVTAVALALARERVAPAFAFDILGTGTWAAPAASYVMAFHDELTALPGRRALNQLLASVRAPYTVAVIDVDRFKSFNDRYGHDVGDQVLRMVAAKLAAVGGGGRPFRSGGEEFTIVFPGRTKPEALPHVQAVRAAVEDAKFTLRKLPRPKGKSATAARGAKRDTGRQLGVTISAGLASFSPANGSAHAVMKLADKAMYRAKKNGRNRVVA
jgi:diguanylate cyclase (GGDEF)-like protein